jgi:hypothetical protein
LGGQVNELNGKIRTAAVLAFLVLMFASSIQTVPALRIHHESDERNYRLGESEPFKFMSKPEVGHASIEVTVKYVVEITSASAAQHKAQVKMLLSSVDSYTTIDLTVSSDWPYANRWISIQRCYETKENRQLKVEQIDSRDWKVYTESSSEIAVEYDALLAIPQDNYYRSYLAEQCGVIYAHALLLTPSLQGVITVEFKLPNDWKVVADERWEAASATSYSFPTSAVDPFDSFIALGPWEIYDEVFGDNQALTVALLGKTRYEKEEYVKNIKICVDYLSSRLGKLPEKSLTTVIAPLPLPGDFMTYQPQICVARADSSWGFFEGTFWHYWILNVPLPYSSQEAQYKIWWFGEAASPFFLYPVWSMMGVLVSERPWFDSSSWKDWYRNYEKYIDTKYDIPVTDYIIMREKTSDIFYYSPMMYLKGAVVLHLLNITIAESTNDAKNLQDLVRYIYENYVLKHLPYTNEDALSAANTITGIDFKPFFDAYVYGNERVPIITIENDYFNDWSTLGGILYPSLPNEEKAAPKYATAPITLELKKEAKHFSVYFHPQDEKMATLLLLSAERAYISLRRVYGGEPKLRIKMFMTYDLDEYLKFGLWPSWLGLPPEGASAGSVGVESGDEIVWLNPIRDRKETQVPASVTAHEVGHAFMRQLYPGMYGENWLSWFDEGLASYAEIECWLEKEPNEGGPLFKFQDAFLQLVDSCKTGKPTLIELSHLENASREKDEKLRLLFSAESMAFLYYIAERYGEDGLHRLLFEYNKELTLQEAAEKAFNISFTDLEGDWRALVEKTAAKVDLCDSELARIRREGFNIDKAEKMKKQEPPPAYLALFAAYVVEQYGVPSLTTTTTETTSTTVVPTPTSTSTLIQEKPPASSLLSSSISIVLAALVLVLVLTGWKYGKLTKRISILMIVSAPVLFILSMLFLANTIIYPAESLPYQIGWSLGLLVAPILFVSGIVVYGRTEKKARRITTQVSARTCPHCSRDLSTLPRDIKNCPYCGKPAHSRKEDE